MDWLTQLSAGQVAQGSAVIVIVTAAIAYVVKFQTTFTDRLEAKGQKDEDRIKVLGQEVAALQQQIDEEREARRQAESKAAVLVEEQLVLRRRAESWVARLTFQLQQAGIEPVAEP